MALHPQCKAFLDSIAAAGGPPLEQLPPADARKIPYMLIELSNPLEQVAQIDQRTVPGPAQPIPVRVYRPSLAPDLPALVYFHGGGFVICDLETHDRQCRAMANASGCVVISVDYRLAPEHKFPAAIEDADAATRYVAEHPREFGIDASRIAVGGDSAGGTLAALVAQIARDRGAPAIKFQLLIYPWTDFDDRSPSMREYDGYFLTTPLVEWFAASYLSSPADRSSPLLCPMNATDVSGLPPAMVITAECDMVRDQGEAYAQRLMNAGVSVELKRYDGMIHPFVSLAGIIDGGRVAIADACASVRKALAVGATAGV